jgi:hypothetical protein
MPIAQGETTPATVTQIERIERIDVLGGLVHQPMRESGNPRCRRARAHPSREDPSNPHRCHCGALTLM